LEGPPFVLLTRGMLLERRVALGEMLDDLAGTHRLRRHFGVPQVDGEPFENLGDLLARIVEGLARDVESSHGTEYRMPAT